MIKCMRLTDKIKYKLLTDILLNVSVLQTYIYIYIYISVRRLPYD